MPKFVCKCIECSRYGVEDIEVRASYKEIKGRLVADVAKCPECGEEREEVKQNPNFIIHTTNSTKRKWSRSHKNTIY